MSVRDERRIPGDVSIHAPEKESDHQRPVAPDHGVSIHAPVPKGERRGEPRILCGAAWFQSTPPFERAHMTRAVWQAGWLPGFNPRPLRKGGDDRDAAETGYGGMFQSTPDRSEATRAAGCRDRWQRVSIHAPPKRRRRRVVAVDGFLKGRG